MALKDLKSDLGRISTVDFISNTVNDGFIKNDNSRDTSRFKGVAGQSYGYPNYSGLGLGLISSVDFFPNVDANGFSQRFVDRDASKFQGIKIKGEDYTYSYPNNYGMNLGYTDEVTTVDFLSGRSGEWGSNTLPNGFTKTFNSKYSSQLVNDGNTFPYNVISPKSWDIDETTNSSAFTFKTRSQLQDSGLLYIPDSTGGPLPTNTNPYLDILGDLQFSNWKSQHNKLGYGKDLPNGEFSGLPFIVRNIGQRWDGNSYPTIGFSGDFFRGGVMTRIGRQDSDFVRLSAVTQRSNFIGNNSILQSLNLRQETRVMALPKILLSATTDAAYTRHTDVSKGVDFFKKALDAFSAAGGGTSELPTTGAEASLFNQNVSDLEIARNTQVTSHAQSALNNNRLQQAQNRTKFGSSMSSFFDNTKTTTNRTLPPLFTPSRASINDFLISNDNDPNLPEFARLGDGIGALPNLGPSRVIGPGAMTDGVGLNVISNTQQEANLKFGQVNTDNFGASLAPYSAQNGVLDWGLSTRHQFSPGTPSRILQGPDGAYENNIPVSYLAKHTHEENFALGVYTTGTDDYLSNWMDNQMASADGLNTKKDRPPNPNDRLSKAFYSFFHGDPTEFLADKYYGTSAIQTYNIGGQRIPIYSLDQPENGAPTSFLGKLSSGFKSMVNSIMSATIATRFENTRNAGTLMKSNVLGRMENLYFGTGKAFELADNDFSTIDEARAFQTNDLIFGGQNGSFSNFSMFVNDEGRVENKYGTDTLDSAVGHFRKYAPFAQNASSIGPTSDLQMTAGWEMESGIDASSLSSAEKDKYFEMNGEEIDLWTDYGVRYKQSKLAIPADRAKTLKEKIDTKDLVEKPNSPFYPKITNAAKSQDFEVYKSLVTEKEIPDAIYSKNTGKSNHYATLHYGMLGSNVYDIKDFSYEKTRLSPSEQITNPDVITNLIDNTTPETENKFFNEEIRKRIDGQNKVKLIGNSGQTGFKAVNNDELGKIHIDPFTGNVIKNNTYVDQVNASPYGGKFGDYTIYDNNDDFIPFKIRDEVKGKWLIFRAILSGITDNTTPEFQSEQYIGRPDKVHVYTGVQRQIDFTFLIYPKTKQELPILWEKINYLVGLGYPHYNNNDNRMIAPFVSLTIGDMYDKTPGYFSGINVSVDDGSTWELDDGLRVPKYISVGCNFTHIGRYKLRADGKHFDLPHIKGMRPGKDNLYPDRGGQFESLFGEMGGNKQGEPLQASEVSQQSNTPNLANFWNNDPNRPKRFYNNDGKLVQVGDTKLI